MGRRSRPRHQPLIQRPITSVEQPWMRGTAQVFGGPSDRQLHPNVQFREHEDLHTVDEVIEYMKGDPHWNKSAEAQPSSKELVVSSSDRLE